MNNNKVKGPYCFKTDSDIFNDTTPIDYDIVHVLLGLIP